MLDLLGLLWFWWATRGLDFSYEKLEEAKDAPETADNVSAGSKTHMSEYAVLEDHVPKDGMPEDNVLADDAPESSAPEDATPATTCLPKSAKIVQR